MKKNNLTITEEKIKNKFKGLNNLISVAIGLLIVLMVATVIFPNPLFENQTKTNEYTQSEEYQTNDFMKNFEEKHPNIFPTLRYIVTIGSVACMLSVFIYIGKICNEIKNTGKPFSENTVKYMNIITTIVIIWAAISLFKGLLVNVGIGIIPAIIICFMKYIFEYGYKLQIESDETL